MTKYRVTVKTANGGWTDLVEVDDIHVSETGNFLYLIRDNLRFRIFAPGEWRQIRLYKKGDDIKDESETT